MSDYDYDLFTIGAGSGGVAASRRAASYGARVAVCEADRVGGTCVIRGCVPKKLLVTGASFARNFDDARAFGWTVPTPSFDWGSLIAAKDAEIERLSGLYMRALEGAGVAVLNGHATLVDGHTVQLGERRITARTILVATGARPWRPELPGIEHSITSNEALSLSALPGHMVIVGGGYIGVELAGVFRSLGARVTLLVRDRAILGGFDEDVRTALTAEMRARGVEIRTETSVISIEARGAGHTLKVDAGDPVEADVVLYATGRRPNTRGLGLEAAGVRLSAHGAVQVDGSSRSSVESVYAVGDCTDRKNLTPVAIAEGRALADSLFHNDPKTIDHSLAPSAVFSQPPVGTVGLSEHAARAAHGEVDVYLSQFRPLKHTLTGKADKVTMKLVVARATGRVVGCHVVGDDAPEIVQCFAVALVCGATKAQFDATIGIHPTSAEELVTMRAPRP